MENAAKERMTALYGENHEVTGTYDDRLAVTCNNGTFIGREKNGVKSWKGIPFAEQPVGELRWKPPVLAKDDSKIYEAYYFGKTPIQTDLPSEMGSYYPHGEDCLYLNVWSSDKTTRVNKPVMVFIYGGAFGWGGSCDPLYDGQNFIEKHDDVILVSIEYRTGLLGFIDFSSVEGGEDYKETGTLGFLDQVCALQWIHNNIAAFGGDPENVTIFGESAGAVSVSILPLMDGAKGLFKRVIAESGSVELTFAKEECQALTQMLLKETGATCMADLVALSEEEISNLSETLNPYFIFAERDGVVIPEDLYKAYQEGKTKDVDMMIGTNEDEVRYWISIFGGMETYAELMPIIFKNDRKRVPDEDRGYIEEFMKIQKEEEIWNQTELYNETMFRVPAIEQASSHVENGGKCFMYYWKYPSTIENYGAPHTIELSAVFNNMQETGYSGEPIDATFATKVQQMWVNFAKTGDPSIDEITWNPYNTDTRETMILGKEMRMEKNWLQEPYELVKPLLPYHLDLLTADMSPDESE